MQNAKKLLSLMLVLVLAFAVLGMAGCSSEEEPTDEATEETGIQSVDDLQEGDKVAVQSGTTGEIWATENLEPRGIEVVPYDDILAAFAALQAGDVTGVINDLPISQDVAKDETRNIEIVQEIDTDEAYGFAFNQDDDALREAVNWALAEVIEEGTYEEIYEEWLGAPPMSLPEVTGGEEPDMAAIQTLNPGKLIIGSDTAYPPFEYVEGGETIGFDVDLMNAIGEKLGLEVEFLSYKFDALITDLQAGSSFDMVASAMTITEERAESVDFSDPYINSNQSLAVTKSE